MFFLFNPKKLVEKKEALKLSDVGYDLNAKKKKSIKLT